MVKMNQQWSQRFHSAEEVHEKHGAEGRVEDLCMVVFSSEHQGSHLFPHTQILVLCQNYFAPLYVTLPNDGSLCEEFSDTYLICCYFFLLFPLSYFTEITVLLMRSTTSKQQFGHFPAREKAFL
jgi:hypothetical protein